MRAVCAIEGGVVRRAGLAAGGNGSVSAGLAACGGDASGVAGLWGVWFVCGGI